MGRTDQVLTGGFFSYNHLTTTMKAVLALLLVCLVQISFAEQEDIADGASSNTNLLLQREVREAAKGNKGCDKEDKKCKNKQRQRKKKTRKRLRKQQKKDQKDKKSERKKKISTDKKGKKGAKKRGKKGRENKKVRKFKGKNRGERRPRPGGRKKKPEKGGKKDKKKNKNKEGSNGPRSSSPSGNGRNTSGQCFTDMVAKTKKFNRAQVEFRLCKRIETWGKLMKNKKNNSASTFSDALEAMNEATGNGKKCEGDSSSLAEAKKVQEKLANCSASAGDNCDEGKLATPINSTLVSSCKDTLETFAKAFKDCLAKSSDDAVICSCIQGLENPSSECLNFKMMHDGVKAQKEKCTKGTNEGSFGDCRKQERMAAKFGNKCKKSCSGPSVTTQAPAASQRMKLLRRLNQKLNFL